MSLYDQWKTASPYDDEPDVAQELLNAAQACREHVRIHAELSDITTTERLLLIQSADTMEAAAEHILEIG